MKICLVKTGVLFSVCLRLLTALFQTHPPLVGTRALGVGSLWQTSWSLGVSSGTLEDRGSGKKGGEKKERESEREEGRGERGEGGGKGK